MPNMLLYIAEILVGVLVNVFIYRLAILVFRARNTFSVGIFRVIGVFLIINGIMSMIPNK